MRRLITSLALLAVAGCAQPFGGRVAQQLSASGLPEPMARCMAAIWVERLNVLQLAKIRDLSDDLAREGRRLNVAGFITRVGNIDDPEIVSVVTGSAARCALRG